MSVCYDSCSNKLPQTSEQANDAIIVDVEVHVVKSRARWKTGNHLDVTADANKETRPHRRTHFAHLTIGSGGTAQKKKKKRTEQNNGKQGERVSSKEKKTGDEREKDQASVIR